MTAQALPNTQELEDKINSFFDKRRKPLPLEIKSLERDVKKLNVERYVYYDFLGQIAGLENNKKDMIYNFENAIRLSSNNYRTQNNYIAYLSKRGFISEAFVKSKVLFDKFSENEKEIENHFHTNFGSCRFRECSKLATKIEVSPSIHGTISKAINIFENSQLNDDEAQHLCELAFSVLETRNLYLSSSQINIVDECVCYTIYVDSPIEDIFDINWELSGVFAEKVEDMRSDVLMFEYSSIDVLEEKEMYDRSI